MARRRADIVLAERGLFESRAKAQAAIAAGLVHAGGAPVRRASDLIDDAADIVAASPHPYVSRGGVKLAHGLAHFGLSPAGRVCLDVGASTGGFTHVLLHGGAARVYAVDVGHGQFDWSLRNDPRVVVLERTNARYLSAGEVPEPVGALVCDASFIGLATLLPAPLALCAPGASRVSGRACHSSEQQRERVESAAPLL